MPANDKNAKDTIIVVCSRRPWRYWWGLPSSRFYHVSLSLTITFFCRLSLVHVNSRYKWHDYCSIVIWHSRPEATETNTVYNIYPSSPGITQSHTCISRISKKKRYNIMFVGLNFLFFAPTLRLWFLNLLSKKVYAAHIFIWDGVKG